MACDDLVKMDQLSINTIRTLFMDAVQQANSGRPGTPILGDHVRRASTHSLTSANVRAMDWDACQALLSTLPPLRDFLNRLLEERLGMRPEPGGAVDVSNGVAVHTTQEETR